MPKKRRYKTKRATASALPTNIIGNIGLFHVGYELSRRGLNVVITSRNTKSVDVIVGSKDFSTHATVQVKTTTITMGIPFENEPDKEKVLQKTKLADFWVYVFLDKKGYKVREVFVWKGGDEELLKKGGSNHWWYDPLSNTNPEAMQKKWAEQKDDDGWRLITKFLPQGC